MVWINAVSVVHGQHIRILPQALTDGRMSDGNSYRTLLAAASAETVLYPDVHQRDRARDLSRSPALQSVKAHPGQDRVRELT